MTQVTLEEAQARLADLIADLRPGEGVEITEGNRPIARLVADSRKPRKPRRPGSAIGSLTILAEDEDHLKDFEDYMP